MRTTVLLPLALLLLAVAPAPSGRAESDDALWYAVALGGTKVGFLQHDRKQEDTAEGPRWVTETTMDMRIARAGMELHLVQTTRTVEDEAGQVVAYTTTTAMGGPPQTVAGTLVDGQLEIQQGSFTRKVPYPAGAVGPVALERRLRESGMAEGTVLTVATFSPEAPGLVDEAVLTVGPREPVDVLGRVLDLHRVSTQSSMLPKPQTAWMDERAVPWRMETPIPMMGTLLFFRTEEAAAKADVEPAELFVKSLVEPTGAIARPRTLRAARFRIRGQGLATAFPEEVGQRILGRDGDDGLTLEVVAPDAAGLEGVFEPPYEVTGHPGALAPNANIEANDEVVRRMAREATAGAADAVAAARGIEAYVREKITKKDFSTGFATAAEVARSLQGDCTEHAVLAAGLARAAGLPARVVMGLVYLSAEETGSAYARGVFGYHMWTEVLVAKDTWLPIDAAIGTMDATHIAMGRSDLASVSPLSELILPVLEAMGSLEIEILETQVPADR